MPKTVKHGWTHRPRSEGGTDPIEVAAGGPISALGRAGTQSLSATGNLALTFSSVYANDPSFGVSGVSGGRATYITISEPGFYMYDGLVFWDTDWTVGDFPYVEPSASVGGSPTTLIGVSSIDWDDTQGIIYGQQFTAAEMDHHSLAATVYFNFDPVAVGFATIGVGINMRSSATRTKNFGAHIVLTRLGDILEAVTIA